LAVAAAAAAAAAARADKEPPIPILTDFEKPDDAGPNSIPIPSDKLLAHVRHYEKQIISQLRSAVVETGKSVLAGEVQNIYKVKLDSKKRGAKLKSEKTSKQLVCSAAKNIEIRTFLKGDEFFHRQQLDQYLPEKPLSLFRETFKTCGVVSSAGSLLGSNLGEHINKNDFVIRFNNAPTHGFEKHVGTKTSLRIVNSQVVGKPEFRFLDESASLRTRKLFSKSPVLVWDPSAYNSSLEEWYNHPDFPFFQTFFSKRLMRPDEEAHLLNPSSLWSIW
jgi:beta-galactoside alpha-2,6-sialyltransferase (sialyltransferase 1)